MKKIAIGASLLMPGFAFAAVVTGTGAVAGPLGTLLSSISNLINFLLPFLISLAVLFFFWGVVKYVASAGDETARAEGKSFMIYGLLAVVVMVSFWGIIGFIQASINSAGGSGAVNISAAPGGITSMVPAN